MMGNAFHFIYSQDTNLKEKRRSRKGRNTLAQRKQKMVLEKWEFWVVVVQGFLEMS